MKYEYIAVALAIFVISLLYGLFFGIAIAKDVSTCGTQQRNVYLQNQTQMEQEALDVKEAEDVDF